MKKTVAAAALIAALTFAGIQTVSAHGGRYYDNDDYGPGYCGNYYNNNRAYTEQDQAALEKFREETSPIRKEIVVKRSELDALLSQDNPDETKVAKLTGELYDLEASLDSKAEAAGIDNRFAYGHGPGMMRGYGWGRGGNMMGW
jgi:Spy/CpxP family protein refolding chaperone